MYSYISNFQKNLLLLLSLSILKSVVIFIMELTIVVKIAHT